MCARYSLTKDELTIIIGQIEVVIKLGARFNIAPKQKAPVILPADDGGFVTPQITWGWQVPWSKGPLINAQAETVTSKPTFSSKLHQRCLVPADGFYEWTKDKTPIRFTKPGDAPFCFAGLWQTVADKEVEEPSEEYQFLILTTAPNQTVARVHNRMPLIVRPEHYHLWLGTDGAKTAIENPDKAELEWCPVQRELNNVRNEGRELIRPAAMRAEF